MMESCWATASRAQGVPGFAARRVSTATGGAEESITSPLGIKDAVVVGAGPAGSATAMLLARAGYRVKVYERRGDPALEDKDSSRAFGIAVNPRGQHALQQLGIKLPAEDCGVKFEGSLRHTNKGTSLTPNSDGVVCVDRGALARHMVAEARARFPRVEFHFDTKCTEIDSNGQEVTFEDSSGKIFTQKYDLLVGADGSNSVVREKLAEQGSLTFSREENQRDYKSFVLDKELWASEPEYHNKMLTWSSVDGSVTRMWAVPNPDGTAQGMLTLFKGAFDELKTAEDIKALLSAKFAGVKPKMLEAIAQTCASAPVSGGGTMVKCSKLYHDSVVLVGDAGHSMFPALGQGCNSAIESAAALVESLQEAEKLDDALASYSASRLPEVSAAADMSAKVIEIDGGSGLVGAFKKATFAMQVVFGILLNKIAPRVFQPPVLFQVNKVGASYAQLKQRMRREDAVISVAVMGLVALLALGLSKVLTAVANAVLGA